MAVLNLNDGEVTQIIAALAHQIPLVQKISSQMMEQKMAAQAAQQERGDQGTADAIRKHREGNSGHHPVD